MTEPRNWRERVPSAARTLVGLTAAAFLAVGFLLVDLADPRTP